MRKPHKISFSVVHWIKITRWRNFPKQMHWKWHLRQGIDTHIFAALQFNLRLTVLHHLHYPIICHFFTAFNVRMLNFKSLPLLRHSFLSNELSASLNYHRVLRTSPKNIWNFSGIKFKICYCKATLQNLLDAIIGYTLTTTYIKKLQIGTNLCKIFEHSII